MVSRFFWELCPTSVTVSGLFGLGKLVVGAVLDVCDDGCGVVGWVALCVGACDVFAVCPLSESCGVDGYSVGLL